MMRLRRFNVWLISLTVVLGIYLVYSRLSKSPESRSGPGGPDSAVADANAGEPNRVGKVGEVGVGVVRNARYETYNENKQLDRVFGFRELLHGQGDEWEVEGPYMYIYRGAAQCRMTADHGRVVVETAAGRTTARDATMTGNVVIRIVRADVNDVNMTPAASGGEVAIYLDDVVFAAAKSQFSTDGFVEVVSQRFRMSGTGLELIYNEESQTLEYMKIGKLDSLRFKPARRMTLLTGSSASSAAGAAPGEAVSAQAPVNRKAYRCALSRNVRINTSEYAVAADIVSVTDIVESSRGAEGREDGKAGGDVSDGRDANTVSPVPQQSDAGEIVVTCDGAVVIAPMDATTAVEDAVKRPVPNARSFEEVAASVLADANGKTVLTAQRIDYCASSGEATAGGRCEIRFNAADANAGEDASPMPVRVTANRQIKFSPGAKRVSFEGDCNCVMAKREGDITNEYFLLAPLVQLDFSELVNREQGGAEAGMRHVTAGGGNVHLANTRSIGGKIAGGVELKCAQFDYDAAQQLSIATGPGLVKIVNSAGQPPKEKAAGYSLQRPCIALLQNFAKMTFSALENRMIAEGERRAILVDYFPLEPNRPQGGEKVAAAAGRIEATLYQPVAGRTELAGIAASQGVTFEDAKVNFAGSEFNYDAASAVIKASGSSSAPCILNGAAVDGLEYNVKTRRIIKTRIAGVGAMR